MGVVPKKHSCEWRTIYHLSYPQGDSINDHIPKDPYSLSYVRVDDAINIIQSLGRGAFMAKTDLKSTFHLIPIHPDDWSLLGIYWQSQYYVGGAVASWLARSTPERALRVSSPGRGHCVVFLGKTLYSHGASLHPGV